MPVKKFNAAKDDKLKEENCKKVSDDKKNPAQKSKKYLLLKDKKKIQILNGTCLEESLDNQMPTSNQLIENKSLPF